MFFTPLVSPAVTPLDTNFHIPDYSAYFSPITSPALDAQQIDYRNQRRNHSSNNTSPVDPKDGPANLASKNSAPSSRRKSASLRNPARVVRQSPSMKPQGT